jgi:CubicO group peptidase (beta-lactamase class C family)
MPIHRTFWPNLRPVLLALVALLSLSAFLTGQSASPLSPEQRSNIDDIAHKVLEATGVPSASLAVVKDGKIAYAQAYGNARLDPPLPATPQMAYSIGSISKQFTVAAVLMLQEQGKLSLDDKVAKWLPDLTRANEITLRQVLSMTSGYQDYAPQDYMIPDWEKPISAQQILDRWARKPLDFEPGTKWQYSNTNYVIAGIIVEKVAGKPLFDLLREQVITPLAMSSALDTNAKKLPDSDPQGYFRYALGPLRPAPHEGPGWMYAAGELAMTPTDLAKWDISLIQQSVLKPSSYLAMETETLLKNGVGTRYGLGMTVSSTRGHRILEHSGEVSGFVAENIVLPDDNFAVAVLTNQDAISAASEIGRQVMSAFLDSANVSDPKQDALVRRVFDDLRAGKIDRALFTENANSYFTPQALQDYSSSLSALGDVQSFRQTSNSLRGGMTHMSYEVKFAQKMVGINIYQIPDGKFEQYLIAAQE